jgi:hypothetical protein
MGTVNLLGESWSWTRLTAKGGDAGYGFLTGRGLADRDRQPMLCCRTRRMISIALVIAALCDISGRAAWMRPTSSRRATQPQSPASTFAPAEMDPNGETAGVAG